MTTKKLKGLNPADLGIGTQLQAVAIMLGGTDEQQAEAFGFIKNRRGGLPSNPKAPDTINITEEIKVAFDAYLDATIDSDFSGKPITRRMTDAPLAHSMVDFAAGFQMARQLTK